MTLRSPFAPELKFLSGEAGPYLPLWLIAQRPRRAEWIYCVADACCWRMNHHPFGSINFNASHGTRHPRFHPPYPLSNICWTLKKSPVPFTTPRNNLYAETTPLCAFRARQNSVYDTRSHAQSQDMPLSIFSYVLDWDVLASCSSSPVLASSPDRFLPENYVFGTQESRERIIGQ